MEFHLADREPVAAAIAAAATARTLPQLCASLAAFRQHPAALEHAAAMPKRTRRPSPLMILAERPEPEDLVTGHPFSGPNGQPMLRAMKVAGLQLADFHVSHAVHWPTPGDRTPNATIVSTSRPFLFREIALVRPRAILALGRVAIDALLGFREPISPHVGETMEWRRGRLSVPVQLSWNPAYCLHVPAAQDDLERILADFVAEFGVDQALRKAA
jgi:DNA polymerase